MPPANETDKWSRWALVQPVPVLFIRDDVIVDANDAAARLLDVSREQLAAVPLAELMIDNAPDAGASARERAVLVRSGHEWVEQLAFESVIDDVTTALSFPPQPPAAAGEVMSVPGEMALRYAKVAARTHVAASDLAAWIVADLGARVAAFVRFSVVTDGSPALLQTVAAVDQTPDKVLTGSPSGALRIERTAVARAMAVEGDGVGPEFAGGGGYLSVPVMRSGRVVGVVAVVRRASQGRLSSAETALVHAAADQLGMVEGLIEAETIEEQLRSSEEDMRLFASALAHDLKAPIRHIASFAAMSLDDVKVDGTDSDLLANLQRILISAERANGQLVSLVEYIRGVDVDLVPVPLTLLAERAIAGFETEIGDLGGTVVVQDLPGEVHTDPGVAQIILGNLLENAIKYRHPERPLRIELVPTVSATRRTLSVVDNGIGLPEGREEMAFLAFRRLHPDINQPGSGMGLTISRRLAGLVHADLSSRRLECGSRFSLAMPRAD
ncbi:MAG: ATP-binding protein [Actinomycetota bacterium]